MRLNKINCARKKKKSARALLRPPPAHTAANARVRKSNCMEAYMCMSCVFSWDAWWDKRAWTSKKNNFPPGARKKSRRRPPKGRSTLCGVRTHDLLLVS